jgi:beta-mannosidase
MQMKRALCRLGATFLVGSVSVLQAASPREVLSLDGPWVYQKDPDGSGEKRRLYDPAAARTGWGKMTIPTNWYLTEVGDYHGVIWFAREFGLPKGAQGKECFLRFNAVDYIADVWINGTYLGRHEGIFAPFEFRVTNHVKAGTNVVVARVNSPKDPSPYRLVPDGMPFLTDPYRTMRPIALTTIKGSMIDHWHRPGWQTQFGQDGNSGGIWQGVQLISTGTLSIKNMRITPKLVRKKLVRDGTALLTVDMEVLNTSNETVSATISTDATGKNFQSTEELKRSRRFALTPGLNKLTMVQTVNSPVLWWSWDLGKPNLYQMRVTVATDRAYDEVVETFGIREIELTPRSEWVLNGKRVFARGMRYHSSIWLAEPNREQFLEDLNRMRALHINAIRIGSHVEQKQFYELCDEVGFMVWQVFPFHYGNYADTDDLIERAAEMMKEMVVLLYNHPSILMWSVFKEPYVSAAGNHYGRLCDVMRDAGRQIDPLRWIHKGDYEEGVQNIMTGWGEKAPIDFRRRVDHAKPQIVEYGTTHVAPLETAKKILKPEEQWPPNWNRWYYLNLSPRWVLSQGHNPDKMKGLEELVEASQTWSAREIKESIEYIRQRRFSPFTSMFLYFWNDPWPCLGGSGILDYYRRKYKAYDVYPYVYTPVMASIEWVKEPFIVGHEKVYEPGQPLMTKIWVTNDEENAYQEARLSWQVKAPNGEVLKQGGGTISVPADSSMVVETQTWQIPKGANGQYRKEVQLATAAGKELSRNYFEFRVVSAAIENK